MAQKAIFLDRDGVINIDKGYIYKPEDIEFISGIFELLKYAESKGYILIIITNQAGIARGYYSEDDFNALTNWMIKKFKDKCINIKKVFFSPYHPIHGKGIFKKDHNSRKPNTGMIIDAKKEFNIDLSKSILIGDKSTDIEAGISAGIATNLFLENDLYSINLNKKNFYSISSLDDAKKYLYDK
tara:strand:+ start:831 stop:1382 length:552 start_codon:yes stop_codon:yes gene_type:complete